MEAAIRWSPHHDGNESRFLILDILNSSIALHKVTAITRGRLESEEIGLYSKLPNFAAFDWSKTTPNIISLGHVSGSASLIKLNAGSQTSEVLATYKAKQQRRCNSTALSTQNWLAVALDKTRSDLCLNIYDAASTAPDPVRRLCPAELISSVRFFTGQPCEVLVGAQRAFVRLYDLRDGFAAGSGNLQTSTKNVNNITIDPLDENYFAAGGSSDDPSVTVWDRRWLSSNTTATESGVLFRFKPAVESTSRASVWSMRYSGSQRGRLAICSSAGELKIVDMHQSSVRDVGKHEQYPVTTHEDSSWTNGGYVKSTRTIEAPSINLHKGVPYSERLVAFDWISADVHSHRQSMVTLRANKQQHVFDISSRPAASLSTSNVLSFGFNDLTLKSGPSVVTNQHQSATDGVDAVIKDDEQIIDDILYSSDMYRTRCKQGYLFDCRKNAKIAADNWQTKRLWETIDRLKHLARDDGMVYESLDFSFVGINGLWNGQAGLHPERRLSPSPTKPADAIVGLNEKRDMPMFEGERTQYPEYRQLCLAVCGWKFSPEDLELECQSLIEQGLHYQAVVQAVLHGAKHLALNLLRTLIRGKVIQNIGLGALVAASDLNDEQRDMTQWMAADTEDPALKALLAYLYSGDWRDVMKTTYLHLGYRMALGLKYLNDTELDGFIQTETARAIKNGDLEGVLLTGLTEQSMDLFQTYIAKTNDLQTAVLASAFTNPLYVDDPRWAMWKETYFMQMQAWRAFAERSRFTVEHNRLAKTREGRSATEPSEPHAKLRCIHCHDDIGRQTHTEQRHASQRNKASMVAAHSGTVCLKCGRPLPRCSICTLWLGTPDPRQIKRAPSSNKVRSKEELMEKMVVFCTKCDHGSHAHHAQQWFGQYDVCPVPGCTCRCSDQPVGQGFSLIDFWQASR